MNTATRTPLTRRFSTAFGRVWNDGVAAQEALLRLTPNDQRYRRKP